MSKDFLDRMARGQLTDSDEYRRMQSALQEMKKDDDARKAAAEDQDWQNWELSPVWSADDDQAKPDDGLIQADSVHRALDKL